MGHAEYGELWREYMNAFAECLLEMRGDETSAAGQRLVRLHISARHQRATQRSFDDRLTFDGSFTRHTPVLQTAFVCCRRGWRWKCGS
jgi:hypothetical protein